MWLVLEVTGESQIVQERCKLLGGHICSYFYGGRNVTHHTQNVRITPWVPGGIDYDVPVQCGGRVAGTRAIARGLTKARYNSVVTVCYCGLL